jgi:hypothetical protein
MPLFALQMRQTSLLAGRLGRAALLGEVIVASITFDLVDSAPRLWRGLMLGGVFATLSVPFALDLPVGFASPFGGGGFTVDFFFLAGANGKACAWLSIGRSKRT